ncbi:MAG: protein-L-isoaspartate(D-aspartate) O-methyltransferase [Bacteroidales bacterium]
MMQDTFRHKGLRKKLVEEIKAKGIKNPKVLEAIGKVPRHLFMDSSFLEFAYQDKAFPIGSGQTISQPYTVAFQTELLKPNENEKVLEIGTGSGYQACVLLETGARVYSVERQKKLFDKASRLLPGIGYRPKLFYGDGYAGLPTFAPFDKILITASVSKIPQALLSQLNTGGTLVAPVGSENIQVMQSICKSGPEEYEIQHHGTFRFVPMLSNTAND